MGSSLFSVLYSAQITKNKIADSQLILTSCAEEDVGQQWVTAEQGTDVNQRAVKVLDLNTHCAVCYGCLETMNLDSTFPSELM